MAGIAPYCHAAFTRKRSVKGFSYLDPDGKPLLARAKTIVDQQQAA